MRCIPFCIYFIISFCAFSVHGQPAHVLAEYSPGIGFVSFGHAFHGFTADSNNFIGFYAIRNDRGFVGDFNRTFGFGSSFNVENGFQAAANQDNGFYALLNNQDGFESRNNDNDGFHSVFNDNYGIKSVNNANYGIYSAFNGLFDGYFEGDVQINGSINKGSGAFKIDHPLDPENKYLYHSFVESPDMMNIYNGNVVTDNLGLATITMPEWFDILNRDFRYQLTVIGTFAQAIVKDKMDENHFVIQTNLPNVEVSWQVTGIRQDPYAEDNRIQVEVEKEKKYKGFYMHHESYRQPFDRSFGFVNLGHKTLEEIQQENTSKIAKQKTN